MPLRQPYKEGRMGPIKVFLFIAMGNEKRGMLVAGVDDLMVQGAVASNNGVLDFVAC